MQDSMGLRFNVILSVKFSVIQKVLDSATGEDSLNVYFCSRKKKSMLNRHLHYALRSCGNHY